MFLSKTVVKKIICLLTLIIYNILKFSTGNSHETCFVITVSIQNSHGRQQWLDCWHTGTHSQVRDRNRQKKTRFLTCCLIKITTRERTCIATASLTGFSDSLLLGSGTSTAPMSPLRTVRQSCEHAVFECRNATGLELIPRPWLVFISLLLHIDAPVW